jgi:hypothetical protein
VCLSVRVTPEEAEQVTAWARRHGVTVQEVLRQCVVSATAVLAPIYVSPEDAARGGAEDNRVRRSVESRLEVGP